MDTDDGVNDFLARVKQLGAQRDKEDEERTRQLEKEILAGRQARQDRRAERAKSLSPIKPSSARGSRVLEGIDLSHLRSLDSNTFDPKREDAVHDALDRLTGKFRREDTNETVIATPIFPRLRQPDSPWQRRQEPRGVDTISPETSIQIKKLESPRLEPENEFRRSSVTRNIGTKDSPLPKQPFDLNLSADVQLKSTGDRVAIAVAKKMSPRVSQKDTEDRPVSMTQVPDFSHEPRKTPAPNFVRSHKSSPSMNSSGPPQRSKQNLFSTSNSMRFEQSPTSRDSLDDTSVRPPAMSPSQGRIDPDRKPTANRGMGAYVQSAMLKREGSISKRWSTALPGGVSRSNTPASPGTRDSVIAMGRAPTPLSLSRDSSPPPEDPPSAQESLRRDVSRARAKSIVESLSKYSTSGIHPAVLEPSKPDATPPTTPQSHPISKAFDQKRWSPTKSSWLESALKKGSEGGSPMLSKNTPVLEPTVKQTDNRTIVIPKPSSPPSRLVTESVSNTSTALSQVTSSSKPLPDKSPALESPKPLLPAKNNPPSVVEKPSSIGEKTVPGPKVELDFRGNLKRPQHLGNSTEKEDLPFLNVISRLRSTKTQNYKVQNVLRDNILAGKAALQAPRPKPPDPMNGRLMSAKGTLKQSDNTSMNLSTLEPRMNSESKTPLPTRHATSLSRRDSAASPIRTESPSEKVSTLAALLFRSPTPDDPSAVISTYGTSPKMDSQCGKDRWDGIPPLIHITKTRARGPKRRKPTRTPFPNYPISWSAPITELSSHPPREGLSALLSSTSSPTSGLELGPPVSNVLKALDLQTEPKSEPKLEPSSPGLLVEPLHIAPSRSTGSSLSMSVIV